MLSGTLRDFDYYNPEHMEEFGRFIRSTRTPVLGICGGHQLVGLRFRRAHHHARQHGAARAARGTPLRIPISLHPHHRAGRSDLSRAFNDEESGIWQDYTTEAKSFASGRITGCNWIASRKAFKLLATAYLCRNQMMVKRADGQLIYTVQFHLEKSFEDWDKSRAPAGSTRTNHATVASSSRISCSNR